MDGNARGAGLGRQDGASLCRASESILGALDVEGRNRDGAEQRTKVSPRQLEEAPCQHLWPYGGRSALHSRDLVVRRGWVHGESAQERIWWLEGKQRREARESKCRDAGPFRCCSDQNQT